MANRSARFDTNRPGFHYVRWDDVWHALDERTIRVTDDKRTLCNLPLPNYHKHRISLISYSPDDMNGRSGRPEGPRGLRRNVCEDCAGWIDYAMDGGLWEMWGEMDECEEEAIF